MEKENNKNQQNPASSRRSARLRFSSAASVISSKIMHRDPNNTKAESTVIQPYFRTKLIDGRWGWVECDGCATVIRGIRFQCMSCADFDLCHRCSNKGWHAEHEMRRIVHPKFVVKPKKESAAKKDKEPATGFKMKKPKKLAVTNKKAKGKPTKANEKKGREQNNQKAGNGGQEEEEQMEMAGVNTNGGEEQQQEGEGRMAIKTEQASEDDDHELAAVLQKASNVKMEVGN